MQVYADYIVISTAIQLFFNFFLLFVIFVPFYKAYFLNSQAKDIYKQNLTRTIRNGEHIMNVNLKNFFNLIMNIVQISLIFYSNNGNDNLSWEIERISTLNCSDQIVNLSISDINHAVDFLNRKHIFLYILVGTNIFIDHFAFLIDYDTYYNFYRGICIQKKKCKRRFCCCFKGKKDENY